MAQQFPQRLKDPAAVLDYSVDWSQFLETSGNDTISSVEWIVADGVAQTASSFSSTSATIWLAGGSLGKVYPVTCRMTTAGGRTEDFTFQLWIENK